MNSNKHFAACLLALAVSCPQLAMAQQQQPTAPSSTNQGTPTQTATGTHGGWPTPDEAVARMSGKLNLSDDQKAKITPVVAERQTKMRALMEDTSSRKFKKAREAKGIMADSDKKIEAVLTKDQKETYEAMKEERREEMKTRMQERSGGS
jgi:Spy/CpxP family protein refolding chaperone